MIYSLTLAGLCLRRIVLVLLGLVALLKRAPFSRAARAAALARWARSPRPRDRLGLYLIFHDRSGEFDNWRYRVLIFIPIAAFLTGRYVNELLAARPSHALSPRREPTADSGRFSTAALRLFSSPSSTAASVLGMFWIGMPYLMRDAIGWLLTSERRWNTGALASIALWSGPAGCCFTLG